MICVFQNDDSLIYFEMCQYAVWQNAVVYLPVLSPQNQPKQKTPMYFKAEE